MGERIKLGLVFSANENWMGGTYYILNLLSALGSLPKEKQPVVTILSKNSSDFVMARETGYPNLKFSNPFAVKRNIAEAFINKLCFLILGRDLIDKRVSESQINVLFPASDDVCFARIRNKIYWFPDFQHAVYPEFFSQAELKIRDAVIRQIAGSNQDVVLSSTAALGDFKSLGISDVSCKVHVIPFAVTHPPLHDIEIDELLLEFDITKDYFIISNQFWKHKNHHIVLEAAKRLVKEGFNFHFVFTGKEDDYRNPGYFASITAFVKLNGLSANVRLLGLIDRRKQLKLMQNAIAVIQPSLFEGWSTVVEDAKSLGTTVVASNISVHREQMPSSDLFFEPKNVDELTQQIKIAFERRSPIHASNYRMNVQQFGEKFYSVISKSRSTDDR